MKKKKSSLKKFAKKNKVLLATFGGAAAGIAVAALFGTEKAKEVLHSIEESINDFSKKLATNSIGETPRV